MKDIRIIFFDIDGTLLDLHKKHMSDNTHYALRQLQKNGIRICIATGRTPIVLPEFPGIRFDAFLTFNGSYCYDAEGVIFSNPIPSKDVRQIITNAAAIHRPVSLASRYRLAANGTDRDLADYFAIAPLEVEIVEDFDTVAEGEVYQIMMGCRPADHPYILKDVSGARITAWWDRAVDIIPANGGKGRGIEEILRHYRLDPSQAMAFGDGNNDLEMLQTVGTGIAMGNASPELKAIASEVCGPVSQDGIYHYCKSHGLI